MENTSTTSEEPPVLNLPVGFRFHPTDEELVLHYLKRKVFSIPFPAAVIPTAQIFQLNPWDLPGDLKEKRFFFSDSKVNSMSSGYWKDRRRERQIWAPGTDLVIGLRRSYVFYKGKRPGGLKTHWAMHEFCLVGPVEACKMMVQVGDWVVCRVYQRRRRKARDRRRRETGSACSSVITEICTTELDQEASSSSSSSPQF